MIKHLLRFWYLNIGYELRKVMRKSLDKGWKWSGLDNLITKLLKNCMSKRNVW